MSAIEGFTPMSERAKQKANELRDKAFDCIFTSNAHNADEDAVKNCALLVVDEILSIVSVDLNEEFWETVRDEIKNS